MIRHQRDRLLDTTSKSDRFGDRLEMNSRLGHCADREVDTPRLALVVFMKLASVECQLPVFSTCTGDNPDEHDPGSQLLSLKKIINTYSK